MLCWGRTRCCLNVREGGERQRRRRQWRRRRAAVVRWRLMVGMQQWAPLGGEGNVREWGERVPHPCLGVWSPL